MRADKRAEAVVRGSIILACSALALALAFVLPDGKSFADQGFNWYNSPGQRNLLAPRLAYATFLLCLFVFAAILSRRKFPWLQKASAKLGVVSGGALLLLGVASILNLASQPYLFVSSIVAVCGFYAAWRYCPQRQVVRFLLILATAAFLVALLPGLIARPDWSSHFPESIADIESHQALTTAADLRLAQGARLFESVSARYGVLWQALLGGWTKLVHPLSIGEGVMFTRWLHALFFAFASIAYLKFSRRSLIAACLAVLFIAPWMELRQTLFVFPQVSSWRYFGFAAMPLVVLLLERKWLKVNFLLLGATAGLALLSDFASGASIAAGLLAYVLACRQSKGPLRAVTLYLIGIGVAILVFVGLFCSTFGYLPSAAAFFADLKNTVWEAAGGTAPAITYPLDPLAILILLHTAYVFLTLASRGRGSLSPRDAMRLCISVVSLFWFVHYVNEPNTFALRACRVLYAFFLIDLIRMLLVALKTRVKLIEPTWFLVTIFAVVIVPATLLSYRPAYQKLRAMLKNEKKAEQAKVLVSGVYLPEAIGNALLKKAEFIRKTATDKPIYYLTADSSFIPALSRRCSAVPVADPYAQLVFARQSIRLVQLIVNAGVERVYVDDPNFITSKGVGRRSCFEYLRVLLGQNYKLVTTSDGWQIWQLNQPK